MRIAVVAVSALAFAAAAGSAPAEAKGCIKGALVGGVAGHYAGHHGVLGALGGCAIGHHMANEKSSPPQPQGAAQQNQRPAQQQNGY